jgi:hypothetical protein
MALSWVTDKPVSSLRKLIAMLSSGREGFRREFLEINGIDRHHSTHTFRASPKNEVFEVCNPAPGMIWEMGCHQFTPSSNP